MGSCRNHRCHGRLLMTMKYRQLPKVPLAKSLVIRCPETLPTKSGRVWSRRQSKAFPPITILPIMKPQEQILASRLTTQILSQEQGTLSPDLDTHYRSNLMGN